MDEIELTGGNMGGALRVGDTVRRASGPWTATVQRYLSWLRSAGLETVPEPLGLDRHGREVLGYIAGDVANYPLPGWLWSDEAADAAARLLRTVHDASIGFDRADACWRTPEHDPPEVICHNDVAPYNLVFRNGMPIALIDFDMASPGPREWDVAYLAYRMVPFVSDAGGDAPGAEHRERRLRRMLDAYGSGLTRERVLAAMVARLIELAAFTEGRARDTGDADFLRHAAMYRDDARAIEGLLD
jgi:Ser/Thr protein kinase RdoA (MazF antagonist)